MPYMYTEEGSCIVRACGMAAPCVEACTAVTGKSRACLLIIARTVRFKTTGTVVMSLASLSNLIYGHLQEECPI